MNRQNRAKRARAWLIVLKRADAFALICTLLAALAVQDLAQVSFSGQANSPQEFDAYLLALKETNPEKIVAATVDFVKRWPRSEMVAQILELQSEAFASLGDAKNAILSGEKAIAAAPDNLVVLTNLANTIANSTTEPHQLTRAEHYARRALDLSQTILIPKKISPQEWQETRSHLSSIAHGTLGLIAYKRGESTVAILELEIAVGLERAPNPASIYRLGLLYQTVGNRTKAIEMLQRAAAGDNSVIRQLAEAKLKSISGEK
jgi:tetratricopeptide (TPR) repeat protein